jgi:hypothetical protein
MGRSNLASRNAQRLDRDKIESAPGYVSSGESMFSRQSATPGGKGKTETRGDRREWSRLDWQIEKEISELRRHQQRATETKEPAEIARHLERVGKTKKFLDRLRAEQRRSV